MPLPNQIEHAEFSKEQRVASHVRLVNGDNKCSGRVEVVHDNQWGTVCDAGWDLKDAAVVCKHMGCGTPIAAATGAFFGQGSGPVWLDDVRCSGNESAVTNCSSKALGKSTCSHEQDAGVVCRAQVVRLVNGSRSCSGRVEVLHDGQWGTVCDDDWSLSVAELVCRELDCGDAIEAKSDAYFGEGSGQIWMDEINCVGNESSLVDCGIAGWGIHDCDHYEDAGVTSPVRLNGSDSCSGRVEVLHDGQWGTVCSDYWDSTDAAVVCKEVGCPTGAEVTRNSYGPGVGQIWMDNVQCTGTEISLKDCTFNGWGINNCYHSYDAGVICRGRIDTVFYLVNLYLTTQVTD
ncbi:scavenger receptor cysteine-rich type 1 protein M130-like [Misgurnus anguillicaudatus]|uniref:scavenger receptor cysteine-rich type 1 protein M130-like n=1 Tax=Misgurnus anguillicaudatus TaxID=75329 RepID=UPI003CCFD5DC